MELATDIMTRVESLPVTKLATGLVTCSVFCAHAVLHIKCHSEVKAVLILILTVFGTLMDCMEGK